MCFLFAIAQSFFMPHFGIAAHKLNRISILLYLHACPYLLSKEIYINQPKASALGTAPAHPKRVILLNPLFRPLG